MYKLNLKIYKLNFYILELNFEIETNNNGSYG